MNPHAGIPVLYLSFVEGRGKKKEVKKKRGGGREKKKAKTKKQIPVIGKNKLKPMKKAAHLTSQSELRNKRIKSICTAEMHYYASSADIAKALF